MDVRNPLLELTDVEYIGQTRFAKKITCKRCGEVIFQVSDHAKQSEIDIEMTGMRAHFALRHDINVVVAHCSDPNCTK